VMVRIYEQVELRDRMFKIQQTGQNWTLYFKKKGSGKWKRIQSMADARMLSQVLHSQKEFGAYWGENKGW
jgi:hypothetical protein